ncbi:MAG: RimK/LysX family protein [Thermodesulfobacteriota bacterium]|nr:RimK/LysX family protein [Thermodesulfobacteriota bacterium]
MQLHRRLTANILVIILLTALSGCAGMHQDELNGKKTVGATEYIYIVEARLDFNTRIDTGARTTSIHTIDMEITDPSPVKKENIGKPVSVLVENGKGEQRRIESVIVDASEVRNAQGVEIRYMIPLTLRWQDSEKLIHVNLRDRSAMTYKLLIGRDWLSNDFMVDVDINTDAGK